VAALDDAAAEGTRRRTLFRGVHSAALCRPASRRQRREVA
jgi:hypothetical protein